MYNHSLKQKQPGCQRQFRVQAVLKYCCVNQYWMENTVYNTGHRISERYQGHKGTEKLQCEDSWEENICLFVFHSRMEVHAIESKWISVTWIHCWC